jgi:hypothetical protein
VKKKLRAPHPAAPPPTSPQGGEVKKKPRAPRKKKAPDA